MVYTGVARVKRLVVLAGQKKAAAIAVRSAAGGRLHACGHRAGIPALAAGRVSGAPELGVSQPWNYRWMNRGCAELERIRFRLGRIRHS